MAHGHHDDGVTPMELRSVTDQLMVKLAALGASVESGFRRLDEKMDRFQTDLHDAQLATNDRINALDKETAEAFAHKRSRIDDLNKRIHTIETWQAVAMAKVGAIVAAASIALTLFGPSIRVALGVPN